MRRNKMAIAGSVCGVLCALCVFFYTQGVQGQLAAERAEALERYGGEQMEVYVARSDIAPGQTITADNVEKRLWLVELLPEGALSEESKVVGRQASSGILKGEVVCEQRFSLSASHIEVADGCTAVSIAAKDVQAVGGAVCSGSHVDIYASGNTTTELIASNVLVLATNADSYEDETGAEIKWITVAVEQELVQEVVAAAARMDIYFTLPGAPAASWETHDASADSTEGEAAQQAAEGAQAQAANKEGFFAAQDSSHDEDGSESDQEGE